MKTLTLEVPTTARLVFRMPSGSRLIINPRVCDGREQVNGPDQAVPLTRFLDESGDYADQWFAFWEEDCMSPPIYVVRAESFEQAYEDFCNEVVSRFPLSESDLTDYTKTEEGDYEGLTWTDRGWISTENVNGVEIRLVEVTCE